MKQSKKSSILVQSSYPRSCEEKKTSILVQEAYKKSKKVGEMDKMLDGGDINDTILCDTFMETKPIKLNSETIKHNQKIYDIKKVLSKLNTDGTNIKNYSYAVQHNLICIVAAIRNAYMAANYIDTYYQSIPCVAKTFEKSYLEFDDEKDIEEKYLDYYPAYLYNEQIANQIKQALKENTSGNHSDVIINIVKDINDEDFEEFLKEYQNLALAFIDSSLTESIANSINDTIIRKRENIRKKY